MKTINREISKHIRLRVIFGRSKLVNGYFFLSFSMVFVWAFATFSDLSFMYAFSEKEKTTGYVIDVNRAGSINEETIWSNLYVYNDAHGNKYLREGFSTAWSKAIDDKVIVTYPINSPQYGDVQELRASAYPLWLLWLWLVPIYCCYRIFQGFKQGRLDYKLLSSGVLTDGKLIKREVTRVTKNDKAVLKLSFEYIDHHCDIHTLFIKAHDIKKLTDDKYELLLYQQDKPEVAVLVDDINLALDIQDDCIKGDFGFPWSVYLVPFFVLFPHLVYLAFF